MKPEISVVIPAYNVERTIKRTLKSIENQDFDNFEVIVVDDSSTDNTSLFLRSYNIKVFRNEKNMGPAYSRNFGIKQSNADIIAFIDADCEAEKNWLRSIYEEFRGENINLVMGKVRIPKSNYIGDAISSLGFPAGANVGFEKIWKVDKKGFTDHISSCNFAARKEIFKKFGMFDEEFPLAGAEDTELSYRLKRKGILAKYSDKALVWHEPRTSFMLFVKWQIYRGQTNYHLKRKIGKVGDFIRFRIWSSWNVMLNGLKMPLHFPMIMLLLFLSFFLQQIGYLLERERALISQVIKNEDLLKKLSKDSKVIAEQFSWYDISKKTVKVYKEVLRRE